MKKHSLAGLPRHLLLYALLCPLLCAALPASAAPDSGLAGTVIFCTEKDGDGKPVNPGTTFTVNQKVTAIFSMPQSDKRLHVEIESRPDGTKTSAVWEAGASTLPVERQWEKAGRYTVTLYSKYTHQALAEGEVTIVARRHAYARPPAHAQSPPDAAPTHAPPRVEPPVAPDREQQFAPPAKAPAGQTQKSPELVPPAPGKAPTSAAEEDLRPAPRFASAGWVYLEDVPEKVWKKSNLQSIARDMDNLLITYSQITFKKGFYVGHWTAQRLAGGSPGQYSRRWLRERQGSLKYTLDVAGKYDRFRATVGPGLWRMIPPNRRNAFGNIAILVDGVVRYKKRFAWNSRNDEIDIDLSQAKTIQIDAEGREFAMGDPYFRKIQKIQ